MKVVNLIGNNVNSVCVSFYYMGYEISSSNILRKDLTFFEIVVFNAKGDLIKEKLNTIEDAILFINDTISLIFSPTELQELENYAEGLLK